MVLGKGLIEVMPFITKRNVLKKIIYLNIICVILFISYYVNVYRYIKVKLLFIDISI